MRKTLGLWAKNDRVLSRWNTEGEEGQHAGRLDPSSDVVSSTSVVCYFRQIHYYIMLAVDLILSVTALSSQEINPEYISN